MEITKKQDKQEQQVAPGVQTGNNMHAPRNEAKFYLSNFPEPTILAYGVINTLTGTSAVFDELAVSPITDVKHQPDNVGWTVSRTGTGQYTLTHNLGHKKYLPLVFNLSPQAGGQDISVISYSNTNIVINSRANVGGALADTNAFGFIVYGFI